MITMTAETQTMIKVKEIPNLSQAGQLDFWTATGTM
jgi:hypothetical protein